jgi:hypothetical protein
MSDVRSPLAEDGCPRDLVSPPVTISRLYAAAVLQGASDRCRDEE